MIQKSDLNELEKRLSEHSGRPVAILEFNPIGGGSINEAYRLKTSATSFFLKWNNAEAYPGMFETEVRGLGLLRNTKTIPVPQVILQGVNGSNSFLIEEFLEREAPASDYWEKLGIGLGSLHKHSNKYFGLDHDNYIGSLKQSNKQHATWIDFFLSERLEPQLKKARDEGKAGTQLGKMFEKFYGRLDELFPVEPPSLVHGDLWNGNQICGPLGRAFVIDPAVYYGFREMDLAMSKLFGGFAPGFYEAYHQTYPLEKGWEERIDYCNLYPLMVHVNLFGGSYLREVQGILKVF